ncbi:hypothetical protein BV25DRAFT_1523410 [Artomyces pyxidatus]|uniref:Uncharacterized protein n=1 Tax=Artomyces pyxidatus TaxID=48021 RepID=A0ACB8TBQ0_9AGAM|nr:hypothetical protein BV25DRAFT_1523410 [Artomyces pyxidatus]
MAKDRDMPPGTNYVGWIRLRDAFDLTDEELRAHAVDDNIDPNTPRGELIEKLFDGRVRIPRLPRRRGVYAPHSVSNARGSNNSRARHAPTSSPRADVAGPVEHDEGNSSMFSRAFNYFFGDSSKDAATPLVDEPTVDTADDGGLSSQFVSAPEPLVKEGLFQTLLSAFSPARRDPSKTLHTSAAHKAARAARMARGQIASGSSDGSNNDGDSAESERRSASTDMTDVYRDHNGVYARQSSPVAGPSTSTRKRDRADDEDGEDDTEIHTPAPKRLKSAMHGGNPASTASTSKVPLRNGAQRLSTASRHQVHFASQAEIIPSAESSGNATVEPLAANATAESSVANDIAGPPPGNAAAQSSAGDAFASLSQDNTPTWPPYNVYRRARPGKLKRQPAFWYVHGRDILHSKTRLLPAHPPSPPPPDIDSHFVGDRNDAEESIQRHLEMIRDADCNAASEDPEPLPEDEQEQHEYHTFARHWTQDDDNNRMAHEWWGVKEFTPVLRRENRRRAEAVAAGAPLGPRTYPIVHWQDQKDLLLKWQAQRAERWTQEHGRAISEEEQGAEEEEQEEGYFPRQILEPEPMDYDSDWSESDCKKPNPTKDYAPDFRPTRRLGRSDFWEML